MKRFPILMKKLILTMEKYKFLSFWHPIVEITLPVMRIYDVHQQEFAQFSHITPKIRHASIIPA